MGEQQDAIDFVVNLRAAAAVSLVATEFGFSCDFVHKILREEEYEGHPAYERYYEILGRYCEEAEHA